MENMTGYNLPKLRKQNEVSIKEVIYKYGPISRSEIAEMLSLTPPTITSNVANLIQAHLVRECEGEDKEEKSVGRKPIMIDFIPDAKYVAGVELGPYRTTLCVLDLRGHVIFSLSKPAASGNYHKMLEQLSLDIDHLWNESCVPMELAVGVGVGLPGFIECNKGVIRTSFRVDWNNRHFANDLSMKIGMPVLIENNARVRVIGAELLGSKIRADTIAYFFISKGNACPLVIKNNILLGETAGAGEVGHMVMEVGGPKCDICGNNGCLDAIASERAIRNRAIQAMGADLKTILETLCEDKARPSIEEILKAQEAGDRVIDAIVSDAVRYLGVALSNIINFISPQLVLVDGYIMKLESNRNLLLEITKKNVFGLNSQEVDIQFVEYDVFNGAKGAAALIIKNMFINQ